MKRGEFLRSLGLSTSTLMAFYCIGTTMTACGSSSDNDPTPDPGTGTGTNGISGTTTGSAINFTVDLTKATGLAAAGGFQVIGDTIVAHTASGSYVALSKTCTHEGTTIGFRPAQNDFRCPNHGSEFSTTGAVEEGPATTALKAYKTALSTDGNTLTVTA
ncbi:QcrA and Rieske domain-containing protein [Dyadobacter luticola]|nr:Rieske 2Fe-2S domain-containing protein [Dyadobacter luticola]